MIEEIRRKLENKKTAILGFGREGRSSYRFIRSLFPSSKITIADQNEDLRHDPAFSDDPNIDFHTGAGYLDNLHDFGLILKTPGIPLRDISSVISPDKITSQTGLFLSAFSKQIIGVTGTKGKSTTSTLIDHILKYAEKDSLLMGNMGRPALDFAGETTPGTTVVYEMSSHQLEHTDTSPHIAVLLNLYQEHLDAYDSFLDYQMAKWNIAKFQKSEDFFIYNADDELTAKLLKDFPPSSSCFGFSMEKEVERGCFIRDEKVIFRDGGRDEIIFDLTKKRKLPGDHNIRNIMAAASVCRILGIDPVITAEAIAGFRGLEHRLEDCGIHNGIHFYNDSIATIPEACIAAVKALEKVDILILGGFDRGIDYSGLASFLESSGICHLIMTGDAGKRIKDLLKQKKDQHIYLSEHFDDFTEVLKKVGKPGMVCLLSPAAASYDEFANFEMRGKRFKELLT